MSNDKLAEAWPPEGLPPWESDAELFPTISSGLCLAERAMERVPYF